MKFFNVVIPTFNAEKTIRRAFDSVEKQTFKDYRLIIVDDLSTDKTREELKELYNAKVIFLDEKRYNGGTRNVALQEYPDARYTLFLDADDEFISPTIFQEIHDFIVANGYPDMVRLPYQKLYESGHLNKLVIPDDAGKDIEAVCWSPRVACWTKAIKTELFMPFPENTLNEDVPQHIAQCDNTDTVAWFDKPVVRWYIHSKSTSHAESPKWKSSVFRYIADLADMELKHDWARHRRDKKLLCMKRLVFQQLDEELNTK